MILSYFKRLFFKAVDEEKNVVYIKKHLIKGKKFSEVIDEWLEYHHMEIAESTYYGYTVLVPFLKKYFGDMLVCDIDTHTINEFITWMKKNGYSKAVINNYCKILVMCLNYACVNKYLLENPAKSACIPKVPRHSEIFPFSVDEIMKLLDQDYLQWVKDGIVIAFHTGMRRGEIYALKWTDINFEQKFIMVQRAQSQAGSKVVLKTTKSACGVRRIDIDRYLVSYLQDMRQRSTSDFVFAPTEEGGYAFRVPWNISWHIKQMCMMAGIPPRNFHTFRHTHATVLLAHGVHPKIVQERLGHSDIQITIMTYSHVLPTIQKEAVAVFERICGKYYHDSRDAVAVFDNLIELDFVQYDDYYYGGNTLPSAIADVS